jgi:hypothetical protein
MSLDEARVWVMGTPTVGKYRWRTNLRKILPYALAIRIPKGRHDCGNHEWYKVDEQIDACYHCVAGARAHVEPIPA